MSSPVIKRKPGEAGGLYPNATSLTRRSHPVLAHAYKAFA
jgi:hypothetical protein